MNPPKSGDVGLRDCLERGYSMQLRIIVAICLLAVATVALSGCGGAEWNSSTQQERNEAAWKRTEAGGP